MIPCSGSLYSHTPTTPYLHFLFQSQLTAIRLVSFFGFDSPTLLLPSYRHLVHVSSEFNESLFPFISNDPPGAVSAVSSFLISKHLLFCGAGADAGSPALQVLVQVFLLRKSSRVEPMACKITLKPKVIQLHWFFCFCFCVFFGQGLRKERAYLQGRQENQSPVYLPKGKGLGALQDSKGGGHPSCGEENIWNCSAQA